MFQFVKQKAVANVCASFILIINIFLSHISFSPIALQNNFAHFLLQLTLPTLLWYSNVFVRYFFPPPHFFSVCGHLYNYLRFGQFAINRHCFFCVLLKLCFILFTFFLLLLLLLLFLLYNHDVVCLRLFTYKLYALCAAMASKCWVFYSFALYYSCCFFAISLSLIRLCRQII